MNKMCTLLIGGNGFIGQALVRRLKKRNKSIYILARSLGQQRIEDGISFFPGSLDDEKIVNDLLPQCDEVLYLASNTTPGIPNNSPLYEFEANINPLLSFIRCLQNYPKIHLLFLSSGGSIYGDHDKQPISEEALLKPLSYHASGKAIAESILSAYSNQTSSQVTILRPSNVYGPGQPVTPHFGLIPKILDCIYHEKEIQIWGDGEITRDYLYIDDLADACDKALSQHPKPSSLYNVYNVGSSHGYTINQVCKIAEDITEKTCKKTYIVARIADVKHVVLDISLISDELCWQPVTDLVTGVSKTLEWFLRKAENV
ncbi:NAD-dependent epimerase/dehydratase family protein [Solemya velesiana gill symbiont]|uniref:NAD-dependent epimerase/dehydratase domain-containing protein n=1 Tax=Solemya velesiana gill symbiont TaxID=1918948 RepID=A0A1T2KVU0_9GAMM|nr:NAD-dependent epimerase/dehydratase family protein [Solemya velesiana gill symbiont]OOZ36944.1 hypothetical protein BOW51_04840 [Solemya velesiana gill symbiont]